MITTDIEQPRVIPDREHWARVLRRAVKAAGLTQAELAEKMQMPRTTVWRKLNGRSPHYITELIDLARLTGTTLEQLFRDVYALAESETGIIQ